MLELRQQGRQWHASGAAWLSCAPLCKDALRCNLDLLALERCVCVAQRLEGLLAHFPLEVLEVCCGLRLCGLLQKAFGLRHGYCQVTGQGWEVQRSAMLYICVPDTQRSNVQP